MYYKISLTYKVFVLPQFKLYSPKKASNKLKDFIILAAVEFNVKQKSNGVSRKIKNKITIYKIVMTEIKINKSLFQLTQKEIKNSIKATKNFSFKNKK